MDQELKTYITVHLGYLDRLKSGLNPSEADNLAGCFLMAVAKLCEYRLEIVSLKYTQASSLYSITKNKVWDETDAKTAKDKEVKTEANPELIAAREAEEIAEHNLRYINSLIEVFNNAHVQFRQVSNNLSKNGY